MDWFEDLFGLREGGFAEMQNNFTVNGWTLVSRANRRRWTVGELEVAHLAELRRRFRSARVRDGDVRVSIVQGDVRTLHAAPEYAGSLFQVASQFNALEMVGPSITPEQGVTRYEADRTQGPACALAAAPALIVRNYLAPVRGAFGQTRDQQLDGLADLGTSLADALGCDVASLWEMRNGYARRLEGRVADSIGRRRIWERNPVDISCHPSGLHRLPGGGFGHSHRQLRATRD